MPSKRSKGNAKKSMIPNSFPQSSPSTAQNIDAIYSRIQELREQFKFDVAEKELLNALKKTPNDVRLLDMLGGIYVDNADPGRAVAAFKKSIQLAPTQNYEKYMQMGQLMGGTEALSYFSQGLQLLHTLKQQKKNEQDVTEINKSIASGCCAIAELYMTDLCFEPNAEQECERALLLGFKEDSNNNLQLLQTMASFRLCQQKEQEARDLMSKVVEQLLDNTTSDYNKPLYDFRMNTVKICIELKQIEHAEKLLEQLITEYDQVTDVWYLYGVIHREKGDLSGAIKYMNKAIQIGKEIQEDMQFLQEIQSDLASCMEDLKRNGGTLEPDDDEDDNDIITDDGNEDWEDEDDYME
jgi:tetratricopeptide (TPR) repeat protein